MPSLADFIKKLKGPDRERIKADAEEFERTIGTPRPEEAGLEEGDLTDYAPQGLVKGALRNIASKGPRTAAGIASRTSRGKVATKATSKAKPAEEPLDYSKIQAPKETGSSGITVTKGRVQAPDARIEDQSTFDANAAASLKRKQARQKEVEDANTVLQEYLKSLKGQ
jgi:hypothetical protein